MDLSVARLAHESVVHVVGFGFYSGGLVVSKEARRIHEKENWPHVFFGVFVIYLV